MVNLRQGFDKPLSQKMLFDWHTMLMQWDRRINAGKWRSGSEPMRVISGSIGKEKVHFVAPPSGDVPSEMKGFIKWYNQTRETLSGPVWSTIAHLYFENIHPFEDGNGRIRRALSEKALYQAEGEPLIISISQIIEADKKAYYNALKKGQQGNEITTWLNLNSVSKKSLVFFMHIYFTCWFVNQSKHSLP